MMFEATAARATPYPPNALTSWQTTLVVAPHPDDESLGCGGAIAQLRRQGHSVHVLFVSDGSMSHPRSKKYSALARRDLREQEARDALSVLGVDSSAISFLRLPDTQVPTRPDAAHPNPLFDEAVARIAQHLHRLRPHTVLAPWRRDPHGDHRATWQLLRAAVDEVDRSLRWIEYPIWVWETTNLSDLPTPADGHWLKLEITDVLPQKQRAIAAHVSQTTSLIDDDPEGFVLSQSMIAHFVQPYEYYLEP